MQYDLINKNINESSDFMVTSEEMKQFEGFEEVTNEKVAYQVTAAEMRTFDNNILDLSDLIAERKKLYEKENGITATEAYLDIEDFCQISTDTMKKAMCAKKITRMFLYKFVVGFKMNLEEANKYFELCGGPLTRKNPDDYICLNAIRDKDSIEILVETFLKYRNIKIGYDRG